MKVILPSVSGVGLLLAPVVALFAAEPREESLLDGKSLRTESQADGKSRREGDASQDTSAVPSVSTNENVVPYTSHPTP